eukprot:2054151-Rhodomonas_salina.1
MRQQCFEAATREAAAGSPAAPEPLYQPRLAGSVWSVRVTCTCESRARCASESRASSPPRGSRAGPALDALEGRERRRQGKRKRAERRGSGEDTCSPRARAV